MAIVRGMRRGRLTLGGVALGVASFVASVAIAVALGVGLTRLLGLQAPGARFEPHPEPKVAAAWLVGIAAGLAVAGLARRRASFDAVFTLRGAAPAEAYVLDTSFGLPASAAALIKARDASGAVPVHGGDVTVVEHHLRW